MVVLYLSVVLHLSATIINIPADQSTIQDGINASANGDTILVQPGAYVENINYNCKNITVASLFLTTQDSSYISQTIIDGNQNGSVVTFVAGVDSTAALCGFTLINGNFSNGGGIFCSTSDPKLENLVIMYNIATAEYGDGGGIFIYNSNPSLREIIIKDNSTIGAHGRGGGIYCTGSNPICENIIITNNSCEGLYGSGGGFCCCSDSNPILENVIISNNSAPLSLGYGGGLAIIGNTNLLLKNVLIINNFAGYYGGGIYCGNANPLLINVTISENYSAFGHSICCELNSNPYLSNCILSSNYPHEIYFSENFEPNSITITSSDIVGGENGIIINNNGTINWLEGNLDMDPLFVGTGNYPYSLQDFSPCVNSGTPDTTGLNLPEFDLAGNPRIQGGRVDMGAYENQNFIANTDDSLILDNLILFQNYPNPFNPSTTIKFSTQNDSEVELSIYNIKGQKIKTLVQNEFTKGNHSIIWNGDDECGKSVSSGIYYYKLNVSGKTESIKKCLNLK